MLNSTKKVVNFFYRKYLSRKPLVKLADLHSVEIVAWCSDFTHLREQLPVMKALAITHRVAFITNKNDIQQYIRTYTDYHVGLLKFSHTEATTLARIIKAALPQLRYVFIGNDYRQDDKAIAQAVQQLHVGTGVITHGLNYLNNHFNTSISNHLFVWAEEEKVRMVNQGVAPKRIVVSGSPYFEWLQHTTANNPTFLKWADDFKTKYANTAPTHVLVAISGPGHLYSVNDHTQTINGLQQIALQLNQSHQFWVKLHRKDKPEYYTHANVLNVVEQANILQHISALVPLIELTHVFISGASTGVIEAMILQKPVLIFDYHPLVQQLPFVAEKAVVASQHVHEIIEHIHLLQQPYYLQNYLAKQNDFLNRYVFQPGKKQAETIISNHVLQFINHTT